MFLFFFSSRRRHTRCLSDWSSDVCSSDLKASELPATYEELLQPRWTGRITIEGTDMLWFAAVAKAMGEEKGIAYFRKLAAMKPVIRNSHILVAQLVASGEVPFFLTAYTNKTETLS